jgi:hypothetical protein
MRPRVDRGSLHVCGARDAADRDHENVSAARKQHVVRLGADRKSLARCKCACVAQYGRALSCFGIDLGREQRFASDRRVSAKR